MSDSDFVDVGDELVVKISGFPVGRVPIIAIKSDSIVVDITRLPIMHPGTIQLPLNVKDYDTVDGYGHHSQPLTGIGEPDV